MKNLIYGFVFAACISSGLSTPAEAAQAVPKPTPTKTSTVRRSVVAEYKRLLVLRAKLEKIPMEKQDREPHKSFIRRNTKDIVYSDPAGQWFVRSDRFWNLAERNKKLPIADDIAWTAAENLLPGECEGYINCYVYSLRATMGRYLATFPNGKHSKQALLDIASSLGTMLDTSDGGKSSYDGPEGESDRAELHKTLAELRAILEKVSGSEREKPIALAKKLADRYK